MNLDEKLICYLKPARGHTLDEWDLVIEKVPISTSSFDIKIGHEIVSLSPVINAVDHIAFLKVSVDPDSSPDQVLRSNAQNAIVLKAELYEPKNGWRKSIDWLLIQSGSRTKG